MWQISTHILYVSPDEPGRLTLERRPDDEEHIVVLAETLDGTPIEVGVEGLEDSQNRSKDQTKTVFSSPASVGVGQIVLHFFTATVRAIRVRIARFVKRLAGRLGQLPCKGCKELVMLLLSALIADLGMTYAAGHVIDLSGVTPDQIQQILETYLPGWVDDIGLTVAIRKALAGLNWVFELKEDLAEAICTALKLCSRP